MYLDTQSPEFREVLTKLRAHSSAVATVSPLPFQPADTAKPVLTGVNYPQRWYVGSYEERKQQTRAKIKNVLAQRAANLKQDPIEWRIRGLRDLAVTSTAQVEEIAKWAIDPTLNQAVAERFQQMSPAELQILNQRTKGLRFGEEADLEYSLATIKQGTDVLIVGDRSEQWKQFVRDEIDPHRIQTSTIESLPRQHRDRFDNVILILPELALLPKAQVALILEQASQSLRPGGSMTLMSEFGPDLEGPAPNPPSQEWDRKELANYAVLLSYHTSLTEAEVALATLVRQEDIRLRRRPRLRMRDVQDIFSRMKFLPSYSNYISRGKVFSCWILTLLKTKE
jgi:hypothetical protein